MKLNKEYPATHSMSTSWFGIDKDGNVALIDFNENGPVPTNCGYGTGLLEIITDQMAITQPDDSKFLNYSDDQAKILEQILKSPTIDKLDFESLVKINTNSIEKFKTLCRNNIDKYSNIPFVTVNEERGIFIIDFYNWCDEDKQYLIDNNIILGITYAEMYNDDKFDTNKQAWVFSNNLNGYPYFLYQQPYSTNQLTERTYVPTIPFTQNQLSESGRKMALRFPFSFHDTTYVQIEKYFSSSSNAESKTEYNGIRKITYDILPDEDGNCVSIRQSNIGNPDCNICCKCYLPDKYTYRKFSLRQYGLYPTILQLVAPMDYVETLNLPKSYVELMNNRVISEKIITLPILPGIPYLTKDFSHTYLDPDDIKKIINSHDINIWLSNCLKNLIESVTALNPQVIIASLHTDEILKNFFSIRDNIITIETMDFPYYVLEQDGKHLNKIIELSKLPFRGICPERISQINENE